MQKLFEKISNELIETKANEPYFSDKSYQPVKISTDNFHPISCSINCSAKRKIAYIDGGNIEIIGNNNFSLQLMRIYYSIYDQGKRIKSNKKDYFVLINTINNSLTEGKIKYKAEVYDDEKLTEAKLIETILFNHTLNSEQQKPETIVNSVRRIYEIRTIKEVCSEIGSKDIIVLDGNLCTKDESETKELEASYSKVASKGIFLCAISKTSSNITDSGASLVGYIHNLHNYGKDEENKEWYYCPICINNNPLHKAELVIAKLHKKSEYAFMIDIFKENKNEMLHIIEALAQNSKDPCFLGYPYGLIDADANARCQESEKEFLQTRLMMSKNARNLRKFINTNKAHDVLDSIK